MMTGSDDNEAAQQVALSLIAAIELRKQCFNARQWAKAEDACERELKLTIRFLEHHSGPELGILLPRTNVWLARALVNMGAGPEAEEPLIDAIASFRLHGRFEEEGGEPDLIDALLLLGEVYRGYQAYVINDIYGLPEKNAMRAFRKEQLAAGKWDGVHMTFSSDDWHEKAIAPLQEAVKLSRILAQAGEEYWLNRLAIGLIAVGDAHVLTGDPERAVAAFYEAEDVCGALLRFDIDFYNPHLDRARLRALEVQADHGENIARMHAIVALLPSLRRAAYASEAELKNGVSRSTANARGHLMNRLRTLAELYKGQGDNGTAERIWEEELGTLFSEDLIIRNY